MEQTQKRSVAICVGKVQVIVQKKFESIGLEFEEAGFLKLQRDIKQRASTVSPEPFLLWKVEHVFTLLDVDRSGKIELVRFVRCLSSSTLDGT